MGLELPISLREVNDKSLPIHALQLRVVLWILRTITRTIVMSNIHSQICLGNLSLLKANRVIQ